MAQRFNVGDAVFVNKDIERVVEGNSGRVLGPYAKEGERGVVVGTFRPPSSGAGLLQPWYAKVRMDAGGKVKTFRLTSLTRVAGAV